MKKLANNLIIIGAGASADLELPTGYQLKELILGLSEDNPNNDLKKFIYNHQNDNFILRKDAVAGQNFDPLKFCDQNFEKGLKIFCKQFKSEGDDITVDYFLEKNTHLDFFGKYLISYTIFYFQFRQLFLPSNDPFQWHKRLSKSWYYSFFNTISGLILESKDAQDNLQIINNFPTIFTFNYDTIFEWSLYLWLKYEKNLSSETCILICNRICNQFTFRHMYGKIGDMPTEFERIPVPHGDITPGVVNTIRTKNHETMINLRDTYYNPKINRKEFDNIFFLGFGFDDINTAMIVNTFFEQFKNTNLIIGTNRGIDNRIDDKKTRDRIYNLSKGMIDIHTKSFYQNIEDCLAHLKS